MTTVVQNLTMLDVADPYDVEIVIDQSAKKVWINVNGVCRLRAQRIKVLRLHNQADPSSGGQVHPYVDPHPPAKAPADVLAERSPAWRKVLKPDGDSNAS